MKAALQPGDMKDPSLQISGWKNILRALRSRNYRLFFLGQGVSLIGTWMQTLAMSWLVYRLSNSAFILGIVGFAGDLPSFILMPLAGVWADRINRRKILVITQTLAMIQAFVLAILVLTGSVQVWHLIVLAVSLGLINAFDMPARQSFVIEMVEDKKDLPNAIALNSSIFNSARLIGPAVAGILIAVLGEGYCFLINGFSFLAVIAALLSMQIKPHRGRAKIGGTLQGLKEGFSYALGFMPIRSLLFLVAIVSLMGMSYAVLMPVLAREVLAGGSHTFGFLMGAGGLGALIAGIHLASRKSVLGLGRLIPLSLALFSLSIIALSLSHNLGLSLVIMLAAGFGVMTQIASCNTLIQTMVEEDKRGRTMGIYAMSFRGISPFGSLLAGSLASKIGAPHTIQIGGIFCLMAALWFYRKLPAFRNFVRPIYARAGIIPDLDPGIGSERDLTIPPDRPEDSQEN